VADNVTLNVMAGGPTVAADEVTDGVLGAVKVQYVKLMDGTLDGTGKVAGDATYGLAVDIKRTVNVVLGTGANVVGAVTQSGTWNVGTITTLPAVEQGTSPWIVKPYRGLTIGHGSFQATTVAAEAIGMDIYYERRSVTIQNLGTDYVWFGANGITVNNGIRLAPGQSLTIDKSPAAEIWAVASTGTQTCSYLTESD